MAKRKKSTRKSVPSAFVYLGIASLSVNALMLAGMMVGAVLEKKGTFDYVIVNEAIERMCSDQFRSTVEKSSTVQGDSENDKKLRLALVDYPCAKNGAQSFYEEGYDKYVRSIGLQP